MIVKCGCCDKPLGMKSPFGNKGTTHGICAFCSKRIQQEKNNEILAQRKTKVVGVARSRRGGR